MIAISLFDYTGNMLKPWRRAGYGCYAFDIQHKTTHMNDDGVHCLHADLSNPHHVFNALLGTDPSEIAFISAFPPCTHLANSGNRWKKDKGLRALQESVGFFATSQEVCEHFDAPYIIENPIGSMSTYWRKPDYTFHPWHYDKHTDNDDNYTKNTCLWTGGGFVMPEKDLVKRDPDDRIHKCGPSPERMNIRSATPMGFAEAVFAANCK